MAEFQVVMLGADGVGKSSLTLQWVNCHFVDEYDPSIEDHYRMQKVVDDDACLIKFLDTAVQEENSPERESWMRVSQGFLCIYDITCPHSFKEISIFRKKILEREDKDKDVPIVLVGNKCDLDAVRQVSVEEGQKLAKSFGCPYFESSAKLNINVEEMFFQLIREIRAFQQKHPNKKRPRANRSCVLV